MTNSKRAWLQDGLLILVLIVAAYFRLIGLDWDQNQHLHPDERFLTMVETALQVKKCALPNSSLPACPPDQVRWIGLGDYLNTASSTLNPQNQGYGFFVYGDLPIVMVRYLAEWLGQVGYDQVNLLGRQVSALGDLLTILVLYFTVARLYDRRVALLTAAFSALAVEQIQQSHFFVVDTLANFFIFLALFCAVQIILYREPASGSALPGPVSPAQVGGSEFVASILNRIVAYGRDRLLLYSLGFGAALGLATASKLNAAPLAVVLPIAFGVRYMLLRGNPGLPTVDSTTTGTLRPEPGYWSRIVVYLVVGAIACVLVFRFTQPYAFLGLNLNPAWVANITELQAQSNGNADVPFALQWARRSHLFSFDNLTTWGLGLPLGILAWIGFLWMLWRTFKGEWKHAVLWSWTALYFGWQSTVFNPTMRYQLPVYPLLCMMAAWFVVYLWDQASTRQRQSAASLFRISAAIIGGVVLVLTAAWAYAFTRIYTRPVTRVAATRWIYQNVPAAINLRITGPDGSVYQQPIPFDTGSVIQSADPYSVAFRANASGTLSTLFFPHVAATGGADPSTPQTYSVSVVPQGGPSANQPDNASVTAAFDPGADGRGAGFTVTLDHPLAITQGETYTLNLGSTSGLTLLGAAPINESDWDDGLPLRLGPEGYDGYGGLYQGGLNLQIYWDDNSDKLKRYVDTLTQGDYIFMSSNRQWATTTRVPERYPLTTAYYRDLIGCPPDKDVIWCYNVAAPGMFQGQLGYKLVAVFESFPTIDIPGVIHWQANDQFAEEAFTVYDHPKVLIFQKQADFSSAHVQQLLGAVDLTNVVHLTPGQAGTYKSLMLSPVALAVQQAGGTWSELFSYDWIQNSIPVLGLVIWYVFVLVLGLLTYPIIRLAMPGLGDKGYPLARFLGLALLGYFSWVSGSLGMPVTRLTVAIVLLLIAVLGLTLAWRQRRELADEWKSRRKYFLMVEGLFLAFFLFDLLIRIGNPDLWHPAKGGERPMDFSFFNAVIKSSTFPPYDPWFGGGYINYYYYGFVLVAMPVKLLGIVPTLAYNFILPTLFAIVALGAFGVGWNLLDGDHAEGTAAASGSGARPPVRWPQVFDQRFVAGLLAALLMVVLGNLGTVRMIYQGLQEMAAPGGNIENAGIPQRLVWAAEGAQKAIAGEPLPYGPGDWYWNPSRVIPPGPGNEITEFPFFTFLYSDLHAHMLAMPVALLALAWALSVIRRRGLSLFSLFVGALAIGALYPTNLSDIYTYLPLGFAVLTYAAWTGDGGWAKRFGLPDWGARLLVNIGNIVLLTALAYGLYEPYRLAYSQGYGALDPWTDSHTPIWSYLTHWGVFLFIISGWLAWETHEWLASTPVSSLNKLRPYQILIDAGVAAFLVGLLYLAYRGVEIGWVALPLAAWAGVLLLRPGLPDLKRFVLFLVGTALMITIVVEIEVVHGDIGRMNTIFKFYLQAWAFLSVSAGAALAWLLPEFRRWLPGWRNFFQAGAVILLSGAALFTITGTTGKVSDRMAPNVPLTLDSITYMQYAQYADFNVTMNLAQDYHAIRWMQDHIQGSPVIVEANCPEYRWCTRFTIYTGLPGVVGWNWHERQQRTLDPQDVEGRVSDVNSFYLTPDPHEAEAFLRKYDVHYIIVGQLEKAEYAGPGLDKFTQLNGQLWDAVYQQGDTTIYQVRP